MRSSQFTPPILLLEKESTHVGTAWILFFDLCVFKGSKMPLAYAFKNLSSLERRTKIFLASLSQ